MKLNPNTDLRAILRAAESNYPGRTYGLQFERETARVVATDGHCLVVLPAEVEEEDTAASAVIPLEAYDAAKRAGGKREPTTIRVDKLSSVDRAIITAPAAPGSPRFEEPENARFPVWEKIVGQSFHHEFKAEIGVDVDLLVQVAKAFGTTKVRLRIATENDPILVDSSDRSTTAYGLVMPYKLG